MFLWKTAGMPVPSSSSSAIYVLSMEDSLKTGHTKLVQVYTSMYLYVKVCNVFNNFLPDDLFRELVFFNTFEELHFPIKGAMEAAGVIKLYEPSPTPCLYVAPAENMVGRVPLMPLFLAGNATPTIPHMYTKRKDSGFPMGCADAAAADGRRGSNVYEVNPWLWQFGRGKPRLGGLSVEDTALRKQAASVDRHQRKAETRRRRKADCT
jgi:hypothetical protein